MMKNLLEKFDELSRLKAGWYDGQGAAPDADRLKSIAQTLANSYPEHLPLPTIVPTPDGNLLLEWGAEGDPSLDIDLTSMKANFHAFSPDDKDVEAEFPLRGLADDFEPLFTLLSAHIQSRAA